MKIKIRIKTFLTALDSLKGVVLKLNPRIFQIQSKLLLAKKKINKKISAENTLENEYKF